MDQAGVKIQPLSLVLMTFTDAHDLVDLPFVVTGVKVIDLRRPKLVRIEVQNIHFIIKPGYGVN